MRRVRQRRRRRHRGRRLWSGTAAGFVGSLLCAKTLRLLLGGTVGGSLGVSGAAGGLDGLQCGTLLGGLFRRTVSLRLGMLGSSCVGRRRRREELLVSCTIRVVRGA